MRHRLQNFGDRQIFHDDDSPSPGSIVARVAATVFLHSGAREDRFSA